MYRDILISGPFAQYPITFETDPKAPGVVTVRYGADAKVCFTHGECVKAIGQVFMHALALNGEVPKAIAGTL